MKPDIYLADRLFQGDPPPLSDYGRRLLAEGDSWFTIGSLNVVTSSNLLYKTEFGQSTAIVNCATPGDTLQRMVDWSRDTRFDRLLGQPRFERFWEGILLSAGGNDLIDAAQVPPRDERGRAIPPEQRLLLTAQEAAASPALGPARFISERGWATLTGYLRANLDALLARRERGINRTRPILLHTYALPTVRPAGTLTAPQGWLYPGLLRYGLTGGDAQAVSDALFGRLRAWLLALDEGSGQPDARPRVHVFDTAGVAGLEPAVPDSGGVSGDWVNEIHLTPGGYANVGKVFGPWIEERLERYVG